MVLGFVMAVGGGVAAHTTLPNPIRATFLQKRPFPSPKPKPGAPPPPRAPPPPTPRGLWWCAPLDNIGAGGQGCVWGGGAARASECVLNNGNEPWLCVRVFTCVGGGGRSDAPVPNRSDSQ